MARKKSKKPKPGRKLPKYGENTKRAARARLKYGLGSAGHGPVNVRKVSAAQKKYMAEHGYFNIQLNGKTRRVTTCMVTSQEGGWYYAFYKRSDTKKNALRNFCSDRKRTARYRATTKNRVVGDTSAQLSHQPIKKAKRRRKKK